MIAFCLSVVLNASAIDAAVTRTSSSALRSFLDGKRIGLTHRLFESVAFINFHLISLVNSLPYCRYVLQLLAKLTRTIRTWQKPLCLKGLWLTPLAVLVTL